MSRGTSDLERDAIKAMRRAAKDRLPVDAGLAQTVGDAVKAAYQRGYEDAAAELADAYSLYLLRDDDMDAFRDALTERLPEGWQIPADALAKPLP